MTVKKPVLEAAVKELDLYRKWLRDSYTDLEEKQIEEESEARQEKMDDLEGRIGLVEDAIVAIEAVE